MRAEEETGEQGLVVEAAASQQQQSDKRPISPRQIRFAVNLSFAVNLLLFLLKVWAAAMSLSLSVIASALDSSLDLLSGAILFYISRQIRKPEPYKYPVSKSRLEPVGLVVFASIMGMLSLWIIRDSAETLLSGSSSIDMNAWSLGVLIFTIASKLLLHIYCKTFEDASDVVAALAQDHRNDVLTNIIGIGGAAAASYVASLWWMDATGAILLSLYIIISWVRSGKEQVETLVGKTASPQLLAQLTYLAAHHDDRIVRVDKVLAYHFGVRFICEVDVVLPEDMPLKETHDIGESLEKRIEQLDNVERAFVHLDYEWTHKAEHKIILGD